MHFLNHKDYTQTALHLFCEWGNHPLPDDDMEREFVQASADEDSVSLWSGLQRPLNWHFYNNGDRIKDNPIVPGVRTSEKRVHELIAHLQKRKGGAATGQNNMSRKDWNYTGRLLHHIQDMSTPSHVVPVYHGPGLKDEYEVFGKRCAWKINLIYTGNEDGVKRGWGHKRGWGQVSVCPYSAFEYEKGVKSAFDSS